MAKNAPQAGQQGVEGLELEARRTQRLQTAELLRAGRTSLQVIAIAESGEAVADAATATARTRQPPRSPLACQEGCAWCCQKTVGTAVPEVERIVHFLRSSLSEEQLADLHARAANLVHQRRQLQNDRWTANRLPCVFLIEDRCLVYPVRPLTCRGFTSRNAGACERSFSQRGRVDIPVYEPQLRIATFVLDGLRAGLAEANLFAELLELTAATFIALNTPDAFELWRQGEPIFAAARLP